MKYTEAQAVAKQLAQDISDLYGLDAWRDQGFANFKQDVVRLLTPALQSHAEAESVIGELMKALEETRSWANECETSNSIILRALTRAREYQGKKE